MTYSNLNPHDGQVKHASRRHRCSCSIPPAEGRPAVELPSATRDHLVQMGRGAAERYLKEGQQDLPSFVANIRHMTPQRHWADVEAGFMGRLQQRLDCEQLTDAEMRKALAVGSSVTKDLLESTTRLIQLAIDGDLVPTTEISADHLTQLAELIGRVTCVGPAGSGAREEWE